MLTIKLKGRLPAPCEERGSTLIETVFALALAASAAAAALQLQLNGLALANRAALLLSAARSAGNFSNEDLARCAKQQEKRLEYLQCESDSLAAALFRHKPFLIILN